MSAAKNLLAVKLVGKAPINWFPGHMANAMRDIRERLKAVDFVLEVRDARIPLSSMNQDLKAMVNPKKHIILLNKADLACPKMVQEWERYFEKSNISHRFVNARNTKSTKLMLNEVMGRMREAIQKEPTLLVMIAGIPNVGKSILTNAIYRHAQAYNQPKKATVGPLPGVTRHISGFKIGVQPSIYLLDTPGVLVPSIRNLETGLKLALTGAVKDSVIGEDRLARYFLALVNMEHCGLHTRWNDEVDSDLECLVRRTIGCTRLRFEGDLENEDDLETLVDTQMLELRKRFNVAVGEGEAGYIKVAKKLLHLYRDGKLGKFTWDIVPVDQVKH